MPVLDGGRYFHKECKYETRLVLSHVSNGHVGAVHSLLPKRARSREHHHQGHPTGGRNKPLRRADLPCDYPSSEEQGQSAHGLYRFMRRRNQVV